MARLDPSAVVSTVLGGALLILSLVRLRGADDERRARAARAAGLAAAGVLCGVAPRWGVGPDGWLAQALAFASFTLFLLAVGVHLGGVWPGARRRTPSRSEGPTAR